MADTKQKPARVSKLADRRVRRTRRELDSAFSELLVRRSYHSIRVSDIAKKADVGRATFYAHFERKEDLLRAQLVGVMEAFVKIPPDAPWMLDVTGLFAHIQDVPQMYRTFMNGPSAATVIAMAREIVEERIASALAGRRPARQPPVSAALLARHAAASLFTLLDWWFERDMPMSPAQMNDAYRVLLQGAGET